MSLMTYLVVAATSWYLLNELAGILRPLLLAVLLAYMILPVYNRFRHRLPGFISLLAMLGATIILFWILFKIINTNVAQFNDHLPYLENQVRDKLQSLEKFAERDMPWLKQLTEEASKVEAHASAKLRQFLAEILANAASFLLELFVVFLYLTFMLVDARKFPDRVQRAFTVHNAERIQMTIDGINAKISDYFTAKVKASLILAIPVVFLLWLFGIKFATFWGLLTFLCNFVPYIGSAVAISCPSLFILLELPWGWEPLLIVAVLLSIHTISASIIEPTMIGKAVGLSPIMILLSLTFWSTCWGFGGMLLAVPLTVMIKIIMENIPTSAPVARMLGDE